MDGSLRVLLVSRHSPQASAINDSFQRTVPRSKVEVANSAQACHAVLADVVFNAVIYDAEHPPLPFEQLLQELRNGRHDAAVIVLADSPKTHTHLPEHPDVAVEWLVKGANYEMFLPAIVQNVAARERLRKRLTEYENIADNREFYALILNSKRRLQSTFDGIQDVIYQVDENFRLIIANNKFAALCDARPADLIGKKCYQVYFQRSQPCDDCPAQRTFETGQAALREQNRADRITEVSAYPIFDDQEVPESVVVYSKDVTEKRHLEQSLIQTEKLSTIGLLASGIAHEIRNPLNIIETARYYLDEFLPEKPQRIADKLQMIQNNVQRASRIINNLLEFSRHSEHDKQTIDLAQLVRSTVALIEKDMLANDIAFSFQPEENASAYFSVDSLRQILLNLFVNAVHAMPDGGVLSVSFRREEPDWVRVVVADTGVGIPEENLSAIFSPFFTTKEVGEGTGLGLYIINMILNREGGRIDVRSEIGKGTTFVLSLPATKR